MAAVRLSKALKELNISLDRVVEFVQSKGYSIEANPNSKITDELYDILLDEFQKDRTKKIASQEVSIEKEKEKKALIQEIIENNDVIKARAKTLTKPVSLGKIDLDEPKAITKDIEAEEVLEPKAPSQEPLAAALPVASEESSKTDPIAPPTANEGFTDANTGVIKAHAERLTGPTVTGERIDLTLFKKDAPKKPSEKPTEQNKSKRKRIYAPDSSPSDTNAAKGNFQGRRQPTNFKDVSLSEEDIQKQVRETLEKLQNNRTKSKGAKYRREKRDIHKQKNLEDLEQQQVESKILKVTEFISVSEVASLMNVPIGNVISVCMSLGIMVTMNQRLDAETLSVVASEFGFDLQFIASEAESSVREEEILPEDLEPRAPIVTVMGHVDHGKTSLLDYIRKENVIAGESGGITQHIGAYAVELEGGQKITFLDTPGHEAFTAMRARGAHVTDLAVIVIAADDRVMPQTKEAISHAQAAAVPIIFAINKVDKPTANPEKIKEELAGMNLLVEDWGGKIQSHDISAKQGVGVSELLEKILLEAELLELRAAPSKRASGTVIEAFLDKGRGYVSTVLVQNGTLKIGDYVLAGRHSGKIRAMNDERGHKKKDACPSTPVSVIGLDGAPQAGDKFYVFEDEREAKQIAAKRIQMQREQNARTHKHITLDEIGRRIALGEFKELKIVLKGDVDGSVEALTDSFQKLSNAEIEVKVIHKGVGAITESDVLLASASDAIIVGFNVRAMGAVKTLAEKEEIDVRTYSIIYDAIDDVKSALEGMLSPEIKEEITGSAEIREVFSVSKVGNIAGCMVMNGKILSSSKVRLIREGIVIYTGEVASLKRFKDDVKEVGKGYDCGIQIKNYNDINVGDAIESFKQVAVKKTLD